MIVVLCISEHHRLLIRHNVQHPACTAASLDLYCLSLLGNIVMSRAAFYSAVFWIGGGVSTSNVSTYHTYYSRLSSGK